MEGVFGKRYQVVGGLDQYDVGDDVYGIVYVVDYEYGL